MYSDDNTFKTALMDHKVYSAWQFIEYTRKNIETVQYCFATLNSIISKLSTKTVRWEQDLFSDFVEDIVVEGKKARRITVTTDNMPVYELHVAGEKVDPWFLFDKLLRDFYQYCMNGFDSISQIANAGLLANKGKKVDSVDFQKMSSCFAQATYKAAFPKTSAWYENVASSGEFQYIEAINNRTKHTADISNKLSMGILGSSNNTKIGPFFRKDIQHGERELTDQLQATLDFLNNSFDNFLNAFCDEFVLDTYIDNRRHEIDGVYQQKMKNEPDQNLAYAFIESADFASMPDELYILLAKNKDEVYAHICPFDNILVRKGKDHEILGRYTAEGTVGDDCLLSYRKYQKDVSTVGAACIYLEMQKPVVFYHMNPFFNVTAVSDDDEFLERSSLPF